MTAEEIESRIREFIDREIWPNAETSQVAEALGCLSEMFDMLVEDGE